MTQMKIRPTIDDVERISRGQAARRRGVGSRAVPHRLNQEERKEWEFAKNRFFVQLRGTGWRRERGDSPLANSFRNFCDSLAIPCVTIEKAIGLDQIDYVYVDFSTLRILNITEEAHKCVELAKTYKSIQSIEDFTDKEKLSGWSDIELMMQESPIWQIPVLPVIVGFLDRKEAKNYAKEVVEIFKEGD